MGSNPFAVFLSYNGDDREAVEKIAVYLADKAKLSPWFDQWLLIPGEPWVRNLERGLKASSACAVFVGQSGEGPWQQPEVEVALRYQVSHQDFRVIPVLLPGATSEPELPVFLSGNTWVDLRRGLDDDDALWRLECGILGKPPGRGRPKQTEVQEPPVAAPIVPPEKVSELKIEYSPTRKSVSIFISYRHQEPDQTLAHALEDALKKAGHKVFIDTGIRWGDDWVKQINQHLEETHYLLLLLSKESAASEMVVEEVAIARDLAKKNKGVPVILPIRLGLPFDEPLPYNLSVYLRSIQQEQWNKPDDTSRLIKRLLEVLVDQTQWPVKTPEAYVAQPEGVLANTLQPQFDPRELIVPGGAIDVNSRFYVVRQADEDVFDQVRRERGLAVIRGPRQTGKTSLIMRTYSALCLTESQVRAVFIDFQALANRDLESLSAIWHVIADHVADHLQLTEWDSATWKPEGDHDYYFPRFLKTCVFKEKQTPILICLDEVDRVFSSPVKNEFFGTLRSFWNSGAYESNWKRVHWLLGTSSEPSFFIEDLTMSPFNVGLQVELNAFTNDEVETLARRHGLVVNESLIRKVMNYLGGRPYLVHLLFYQMVRKPEMSEQLFDADSAGGGIFRDHLHRYLMHFQRQETLAKAMKNVINGNGCDDVKLANRLEAAGLVRRDQTQKLVPQCQLYADFFRKELK